MLIERFEQLEVWLCRDLECKVNYDSLVEQAERVGRMLTGLINSVRT